MATSPEEISSSTREFCEVTTGMPLMQREERPAPPPGVEVLTVPEAVAYAADQAKQRGDRRALLMQQDVRKDITAGRFEIGREAYWVSVQAHPKGGYWVVTTEAVERRIQERLRGRGRPARPKVADDRSETQIPPDDAPSAPVQHEPEKPVVVGAEPVEQVAVIERGMSATPGVTHQVGEIEAGQVVTVVYGDHDYLPFPVADVEKYRAALAESVQLDKQSRGMFNVCSCGWAGQESSMRKAPYPNGIGWEPVCPSCGRKRSDRENFAYVSAVVRELPWVQKQVREASERTRNEKWATEMRKHLRHLGLLARQAALEEPVTAGVVSRVDALTDEVQRLLAGTIVLPPAMRTEPTWRDLKELANPLVKPALEHLDVFRLDGPVVESVLGAVQRDGVKAYATAVLDKELPWQAVWPTLRWLAQQEAGGEDLKYPTHLMELLKKVPARDLEKAIMVYHQVRRRGKEFLLAGEEWARDNYGANRRQWETHRSTAEMLHQLLGAMEGLLMTVAKARVQAQVDDEVARLTELARAEAARKGRPALQIAAAWVRSGKHFSNPELVRLAAHPLAQRLAADGSGGGTL